MKALELQAILFALEKLTECARTSPLSVRGKCFTVFTDSLEALKEFTKTPRVGTLAHNVKVACATLHELYGLVVRVDWVPGHASGISNGAAHDAASELVRFRSSPLDAVPQATLLFDPRRGTRVTQTASKTAAEGEGAPQCQPSSQRAPAQCGSLNL